MLPHIINTQKSLKILKDYAQYAITTESRRMTGIQKYISYYIVTVKMSPNINYDCPSSVKSLFCAILGFLPLQP